MGIDFDSLWGQAKDAVSGQIQQVETIGVPALESSLETWGATVLTKQAQASQAAVNSAVAAAPPAAPGSLAAAFQGTLKNAVASNYSIPLILGALVVGFLVFRKA